MEDVHGAEAAGQDGGDAMRGGEVCLEGGDAVGEERGDGRGGCVGEGDVEGWGGGEEGFEKDLADEACSSGDEYVIRFVCHVCDVTHTMGVQPLVQLDSPKSVFSNNLQLYLQ